MKEAYNGHIKGFYPLNGGTISRMQRGYTKTPSFIHVHIVSPPIYC